MTSSPQLLAKFSLFLYVFQTMPHLCASVLAFPHYTRFFISIYILICGVSYENRDTHHCCWRVISLKICPHTKYSVECDRVIAHKIINITMKLDAMKLNVLRFSNLLLLTYIPCLYSEEANPLPASSPTQFYVDLLEIKRWLREVKTGRRGTKKYCFLLRVFRCSRYSPHTNDDIDDIRQTPREWISY